MPEKQMDNDDCIQLRKLAAQYNTHTKLVNESIRKWMMAEVKLDKALILHRIKDTLAWKKQVISLLTLHPEYDDLHTDYMINKCEEKCHNNVLKAIEQEMNALKKTYEETPNEGRVFG